MQLDWKILIQKYWPVLLVLAFFTFRYVKNRHSLKNAEAILQANNYQLLDVRTLGEYQQNSIPKSIHIPVSELSSRLKELDKNKPIVVYCASGVRSSSAKTILINSGFTKVVNGGGINGVQSALNKLKNK